MYIIIILPLLLCGVQLVASNCHSREIEFCTAPLILYVQGGDLPTTEEDLDDVMEVVNDGYHCLLNYTTKCISPLQREVLDLVTEGISFLIKELGTKGSEIRKEVLAHAPCVSEAYTKPEIKAAFEDLNVGLESIMNAPFKDRPATICCTLNRLADSVREILKAECGEESVKVAEKLIETAVTDFPSIMCASFPESGSTCARLLKPKGTKSDGSKSKFHLIRLLSLSSG
uniref:U85-Liphistoxin-Lth1a_1 n=1 Tax=Liphistius thaleban TaxID=1905330 RepID=A0A4Q8K3A4_9ARAC